MPRYGYGYVRVSTDKQEELSPDSQEKLIREYGKKNNIVILKIYNELGVSGRSADKRPAFQEMIGSAKSKEHPVDTILVWKYSRFARNQEESIVYKSLLKKQNNVDVISVSEPLVDGPFGSLIERIIEWMDEYYSIRLSGEVFRGMKENAMRGSFQARPPLGYRIAEHGKPPVIVPEEADIVKLIFHKYVHESSGFFDIARYLNSLGYTSLLSAVPSNISSKTRYTAECSGGTERTTPPMKSKTGKSGLLLTGIMTPSYQRSFMKAHRCVSKVPTSRKTRAPLPPTSTGFPD